MKNRMTNVIIIAVLSISAIGFFGYHFFTKRKGATNPFSSQDKYSSNEANDFIPLVTVNNIKYKYEDLPMNVQQELFKEELSYQIRKNAVLKSFAIRMFKINEKNPEQKIDELPPLINFINLNVPKEDLDKRYQFEKDKYPSSMSPELVKSQISFSIISTRAINFYNYVLGHLIENKLLKLRNDFPFIPKEWLKLENYPHLGNPDAKNKMIFFGNYLCDNCSLFNLDLINLINKIGPDNLEVTYISMGDNNGGDFYFGKNATCLAKQNAESFWTYHKHILSVLSKGKYENKKENFNLFEVISKDALSKTKHDPNLLSKCVQDNKLNSEHFSKIKKDFSFLELQELPVVILNNRKVDIEGKSISTAYEEYKY